MINAVIFDMDGVIVLSEECHIKAWNIALKGCKKRIDKDLFDRKFSGVKTADCMRILFPEKPDSFIDDISDRKQEVFREIFKPKPNDGLLGLLRMLKANNLRIGLATAAPKENAAFILGNLGIMGFFYALTSSDDVEHAKPDPRIYLKAAERCNMAPENCLVIEDAVFGIQAAKAAGMRCIAITTTRKRKDLEKAGADLVVGSLKEITANVIKRIGGG